MDDPDITSRAVLLGHLTITIPVVAAIPFILFIGLYMFGPAFLMYYICAGLAVSWQWYSIAIPRWEESLQRKGVQENEIPEIRRRAGLLWPGASSVGLFALHTTAAAICALRVGPWLVGRWFAWILPLSGSTSPTGFTAFSDCWLQHFELVSILPAQNAGASSLKRPWIQISKAGACTQRQLSDEAGAQPAKGLHVTRISRLRSCEGNNPTDYSPATQAIAPTYFRYFIFLNTFPLQRFLPAWYRYRVPLPRDRQPRTYVIHQKCWAKHVQANKEYERNRCDHRYRDRQMAEDNRSRRDVGIIHMRRSIARSSLSVHSCLKQATATLKNCDNFTRQLFFSANSGSCRTHQSHVRDCRKLP